VSVHDVGMKLNYLTTTPILTKDDG